ncbi:MAG: serine hydrolase domain-containing protein [Lentilactobacillus diolivorans]
MKRGRLWASGLLILTIICVGGALTVWRLDSQHVRQAVVRQPAKEKARDRRSASDHSKNNNNQSSTSQRQKLDLNRSNSPANNVTRYLRKNHFVGSALIIRNDRLIYRKAFGYANYLGRVKNRTNSEFQILSIQKSLTAACVMKLIQEKRLSLTTRLATFYPSIPNAKQIEIRNLLDMDSGIAMKQLGSNKVLKENQVVDYAVKHLSSKAANLGKWNYQPVNYVLLAGIIARLTHKSYQQYFSQVFTKPMHLKGTGFVQDQPVTVYQTTGYRYLKKTQVSQNYQKAFNEPRASMFNELGTGQVYMTPFELFKAEHYLLRGKVISLRNVKTLHTPGSSSTYGGGVYNQPNGIRSHGIGYGYESSLFESRNGKFGVVLLTNNYRPAVSIQNLAETLYDQVMAGTLT